MTEAWFPYYVFHVAVIDLILGYFLAVWMGWGPKTWEETVSAFTGAAATVRKSKKNPPKKATPKPRSANSKEPETLPKLLPSLLQAAHDYQDELTELGDRWRDSEENDLDEFFASGGSILDLVEELRVAVGKGIAHLSSNASKWDSILPSKASAEELTEMIADFAMDSQAVMAPLVMCEFSEQEDSKQNLQNVVTDLRRAYWGLREQLETRVAKTIEKTDGWEDLDENVLQEDSGLGWRLALERAFAAWREARTPNGPVYSLGVLQLADIAGLEFRFGARVVEVACQKAFAALQEVLDEDDVAAPIGPGVILAFGREKPPVCLQSLFEETVKKIESGQSSANKYELHGVVTALTYDAELPALIEELRTSLQESESNDNKILNLASRG